MHTHSYTIFSDICCSLHGKWYAVATGNDSTMPLFCPLFQSRVHPDMDALKLITFNQWIVEGFSPRAQLTPTGRKVMHDSALRARARYSIYDVV